MIATNTFRTVYKQAMSPATHLVEIHPSKDSPLLMEGGNISLSLGS